MSDDMMKELAKYVNIESLLNFKMKAIDDNGKSYYKDIRLSKLWDSEREYLTKKHQKGEMESFYNYLDICFEFRVAELKGLFSRNDLKDKWLNIVLGFKTWKI